MGKGSLYPSHSASTSTKIWGFDANGNLVNFEQSDYNTYVAGVVQGSTLAFTEDNTHSGSEDFTSGTILVAEPTADSHAATKSYVLAQIADAVGLNPDSANTWGGVQTFNANNVSNGDNTHNGVEIFESNIRINGNGTISSSLQLESSGSLFAENNSGGAVELQRSSDGMEVVGGDATAFLDLNVQTRMPSIPTTDPAEAGQLWSDSGTLKVSAG